MQIFHKINALDEPNSPSNASIEKKIKAVIPLLILFHPTRTYQIGEVNGKYGQEHHARQG